VGFTLYLGRALRQREQKDVEHLIEPWYVVHDGMETDVICGMLRQEGIKRFHRSLTEAGSTWSMGTRTEVLVDDANLDRARELLASSDSEEGDDD
jgi:hypothetical protein